MKRMICQSIKEIQVQGITLVEVVWASSTGNVTATSRAQTLEQYEVGATYSGKLSYLPKSTIRTFSALSKAA